MYMEHVKGKDCFFFSKKERIHDKCKRKENKRVRVECDEKMINMHPHEISGYDVVTID